MSTCYGANILKHIKTNTKTVLNSIKNSIKNIYTLTIYKSYTNQESEEESLKKGRNIVKKLISLTYKHKCTK